MQITRTTALVLTAMGTLIVTIAWAFGEIPAVHAMAWLLGMAMVANTLDSYAQDNERKIAQAQAAQDVLQAAQEGLIQLSAIDSTAVTEAATDRFITELMEQRFWTLVHIARTAIGGRMTS